MKATQFKDEAQKRSVFVEVVRSSFEKDISKGLVRWITTPDGAEVIYFEPNEIEALIAELSSGKISLASLSEQLNSTIYQINLVLKHLLKTNQVDGELAYSSFTSKATLKKTSLQKAAQHKRIHRLKTKNKQHSFWFI